MRILFLFLLCFTLSSCHSQKTSTSSNFNQIKTDFAAINSDSEINGSILVYDLNNNSYYSNDFEWAKKGQLPASTFKIPNSLIALELGIIENENTIFKWDGKPRMFEIWQQDLTFKQAFHYSCVPCYQDMARKINSDRMNKFIKKFKYGNLDISSENIDNFWLVGHSEINQFEQIEFLKKLYNSQLPITSRTEQVFKEMFISEQSEYHTLRAKTGMTFGDYGKGYNGWYVGYVESKDNVFFFATNISPAINYHNSFNNKRKSITINALIELGFING